MIRILHISQSLGGVANSLNLIFSNIDKERFELTLVAPDSPELEEHVRSAGFDYIPLNMKRQIGFHDVIDVFKILKIMSAKQYDLVHCHSAKAGVLGRIAAFLQRKPVIYSPRGWSYLSQEGWRRSFFRNIERLMVPCTDRIVVASASEAALGKKEVWFNENKMNIVNNSFFPSEVEQIEHLPLPIIKEYVLTIGRITYQKNIDQFINVAEYLHTQFPHLKFIIKGSGYLNPLEEKAKTLVMSKNLHEVVVFVPWGAKIETLNWIRGCTIYVHTALFEALPNVILEAMAIGKPAVATNTVGNCDTVIDGVTGYLTELNDVEGMAKKIAELLRDKEKARAFGEAGKSYAWENFDIRKNIKLLEKIYCDLLSKKIE
jgi:glycosyltransferase involved in cell wall biosynthesis